MSKKANPTMIGTFVVGAVALIIAGLLVYGSGRFFRERTKYVLYFEGSVKGLKVGAPVDFRGVKIGTVTDIQVRFDRRDMSFRIPVFIELEPNRVTEVCCDEETRKIVRETQPARIVEALVAQGLRAKVELESLVTGLLFVQFDFYPDTTVNLVGDEQDIIELPTIQSSLQQISKTIEKLPIETLVNKTMNAIEGIEKVVNSPEFADTIGSLNLALKELQKLAANLDSRVEPLAVGIDETLNDVRTLTKDIDAHSGSLLSSMGKTSRSAQKTIEQAQKTLMSIDAMAAEQSPLRYELENTLAEVSAAARSFRQMVDYLKRHPESLLYGKRKAGGK